MQEEHELELMDYLRILWWGKWFVVACLVLATGVAAVVMWSRPPSYSATGLYEVRESLSLYAPSQNAAALTQYVVQALPRLTAAGLQRSISQRDPNLIDVSISGTASRTAIENTFASSIAVLEAGLVAQAERILDHERARAEAESQELAAQTTMVRARMAEETSKAGLEAFAEVVAALEVRLAQVSVRRGELTALVPRQLVSLRDVGQYSIVELHSSSRLTIAAAAFLGLLLGMLAAFLAHYLTSAAHRDAATHEVGTPRR